MYPLLLTLGPFGLRTAGMVAIGAVIITSMLAAREIRHRGYPPALIYDAITPVLLAGVAGARLAYVLLFDADRERFVREHFDTAWGWYDRLTALCTGCLVHLWRERCVEACGLGPEERVLDVATGRGPLRLRARRSLGPGGLAVGLDPSAEGLRRARTAIGDGVPTGWIQAQAPSLPFHAPHDPGRARPEDLREEMRRAGLELERAASLCVGIVWLFVARRT